MKLDALQKLVAEYQNLISEDLGEARPAELQQLHVAAATTFLMTMGSLGECRRDTPYSPLRPVIDRNGVFKWCCNHPDEHCGS